MRERDHGVTNDGNAHVVRKPSCNFVAVDESHQSFSSVRTGRGQVLVACWNRSRVRASIAASSQTSTSKKYRFILIALCFKISCRLRAHEALETAGFSDLVRSVRLPILFTASLRLSVARSRGKFPRTAAMGQFFSHCTGMTCSTVNVLSTRTISVLLERCASSSASRIMRNLDRLTFR